MIAHTVNRFTRFASWYLLPIALLVSISSLIFIGFVDTVWSLLTIVFGIVSLRLFVCLDSLRRSHPWTGNWLATTLALSWTLLTLSIGLRVWIHEIYPLMILWSTQ